MRRLSARREHVLVEQPALCQFLEATLRRRSASQLLYRAGPAALARGFAALAAILGLPIGGLVGLTLASLRAGGATWFFGETRDLELVRWRGRWGTARTLEVYIQEVGSLHVLASVDQQVRDRVTRFASAFPHSCWGPELSRWLLAVELG